MYDVPIIRMKQCSRFMTQNTKPMSQERGTKNELQQETKASYKTPSCPHRYLEHLLSSLKIINLCYQAIQQKFHHFLVETLINHSILSSKV